MPIQENFSGVSNCYVFKSRLQEYAQKVGLPTPVYETLKEGPSHEPSFSSTVIVNGVKYESLPGFFNRKAAEQSAAEVALMELFKAGEVNESISQPVHETGLCKNLLQEYAQKMNYAIPVYHIQKDEAPGRLPHFSCTVEIGGIRYIGASAKTKKEAEIKAARTALLAIQSSTSAVSDKEFGNSQLTVIPCKKRPTETACNPDGALNVPKAKKSRFKKKMLKTKLTGNNADHSQDIHTGNSGSGSDDQLKSESVQTDTTKALSSELMSNLHDKKTDTALSEQEMPSTDVALAPQVADNSKNGQLIAVNSVHNNFEAPDMEKTSMDPQVADNSKNGQLTAVNSVHSNFEAPDMEKTSMDPQVADNSKKGQLTVMDSVHSNFEAPDNEKTSMDPQVADNCKIEQLTAVNSIHGNHEAPDMENTYIDPQVSDNSKIGQVTAVNSIHGNHEAPNVEKTSMVCEDQTDLVKPSNRDEVASIVNDFSLSQVEASETMSGLNQAGAERISANADQV